MGSHPGAAQSQGVDIGDYSTQILSEDDRPLFDEAVEAAKVGALRAAYVMIWLSCAESLKRRFRETQQRDGVAAKIVGDIEAKEKASSSECVGSFGFGQLPKCME